MTTGEVAGLPSFYRHSHAALLPTRIHEDGMNACKFVVLILFFLDCIVSSLASRYHLRTLARRLQIISFPLFLGQAQFRCTAGRTIYDPHHKYFLSPFFFGGFIIHACFYWTHMMIMSQMY